MRGGYRAAVERIRAEVRAMVNAGNHHVRRGKKIPQRKADAIHRRAADRKSRYLRQTLQLHFLSAERIHQGHCPAHRAALPVRSGNHYLMRFAQLRRKRLDSAGIDAVIVA
ncbi:hypothetical protein SDC9_118950 [bioreactor metagenome]|uniref:Uncharacterized protein n=1 Tax=bioreactor metagenome TaxID=1076179 RepID=A0A645C3N5_9ZZZZ